MVRIIRDPDWVGIFRIIRTRKLSFSGSNNSGFPTQSGNTDSVGKFEMMRRICRKSPRAWSFEVRWMRKLGSAPSVGFLERNARERWQRMSVEHAKSLESFVRFASKQRPPSRLSRWDPDSVGELPTQSGKTRLSRDWPIFTDSVGVFPTQSEFPDSVGIPELFEPTTYIL